MNDHRGPLALSQVEITHNTNLNVNLGNCDEELGAVCITTGICHRQQVTRIMFEFEVLVVKLVAVDAAATGSIVVLSYAGLQHFYQSPQEKKSVLRSHLHYRKIPALTHEARDHAMK